MMNDDSLGAYNIADLREMARRRLPKGIFEFIDRGTEDEVALRNNRFALERIKLRPRTLVDVSQRSQEITLFEKKQSMPIVIAPTGTTGQVWYRGEIALARAAAAAGIPFTLATGSTTALEQVIKQGGGRMWFQLYIWPDRAVAYEMVERVKAAGFEALVVTIDSPVSPNREFNLRNGFTLPFRFTSRTITDALLHPRWLFGVIARHMLTTGMPRYENYPSEVKSKMTARPMGHSMMKNDSLTWDDLRALRKMWPRTLIAKGILRPQDAVLAAECGADAVVLSNHGGLLVDSAIAPIDALPETLDAVGKRIPVLIDSGYRRGSDVVKALALGAKAVLVGRATLYGTAAAGEAGAARAIAILREEIDRVLALIGCPDVEALDPGYVVLPRAA
jgi:isopentenyl diphosphate isomerase/L-lactate dehydrogenase-like FMN-dependent dehydrogenase